MALLDVDQVTVRFGGLQALDHVSITIDAGQVTGLIGPNGAGKTTLFNVVCGLQAPNGGTVVIDGVDVTHDKPHRRARLGIARTFQRLETFGTLSTRENVLVAAEMRRGWSRERVDQLPTGTARLIEVARALASKPRVLLLDEPSSGLNDSETHALGSMLHELARDGLGVLLVEHDMSFVMAACDYIHVLDFGRVIASGTPKEIQRDPIVRAAYLGSSDSGASTEASALRSHVRVVAGFKHTSTLQVQDYYENFDTTGAYAISLMLAATAVLV